MSISLIRLNATAVYRAWLKIEYLFRLCSVATDMMKSFQFHSFVLLCCAVSSQLRNDSVFTHFHSYSRTATISATKWIRNRSGTTKWKSGTEQHGLVETLVPVQNGPKLWWNICFRHVTRTFVLINVIRRIIVVIVIVFLFWERSLIFGLY